MSKRVQNTVLVVTAMFTLASCGYRGALYLPEQPPTQPDVEQTDDAPQETRDNN